MTEDKTLTGKVSNIVVFPNNGFFDVYVAIADEYAHFRIGSRVEGTGLTAKQYIEQTQSLIKKSEKTKFGSF